MKALARIYLYRKFDFFSSLLLPSSSHPTFFVSFRLYTFTANQITKSVYFNRPFGHFLPHSRWSWIACVYEKNVIINREISLNKTALWHKRHSWNWQEGLLSNFACAQVCHSLLLSWEWVRWGTYTCVSTKWDVKWFILQISVTLSRICFRTHVESSQEL